MKKLFFSVAIIILFVGLGNKAMADDFKTAIAKAGVVGALSIDYNADLNFGNFIPSGALGTVTIAPDIAGSRSQTGVTPIGTGTAAAKFTVNSYPGASVIITLPLGPVTVKSGANTMTVDNFKLNTTDFSSPVTMVTSTYDLYVGATINVGIAQPVGVYTSTGSIVAFEVAVSYE